MKVRTGFVSNSSSSSFCILGTSDEKIIKQIDKALEEKYPDDEIMDLYDDFGFEFHNETEDGDVLGLNIKEVFTKEVIKEAATIVQLKIKEKSGIEIPLNKLDIIWGEYPC